MTQTCSPRQFEPVATLSIICLHKLRSGDLSEREKLRKVCSKVGVFYLDISGCSDLLSLWANLLRFSRAYFSQTLDAKQRNDHGSEVYGITTQDTSSSARSQRAYIVKGYEAVGTSEGLSADLVNGYESLKFAYHSPVMAKAPLSGGIIDDNLSVIRKFQESARDALMQVLASLSEEDVVRLHHSTRASRTNSVFLRYPRDAPNKAAGHNEHSDMGTLTLLLTSQWGLQIQDPADHGWKFVAPSTTQAIVNVGDSLNYISEGKYLSALHRVIRINDGTQEDKYSVAFFLRPADDAEYRHSDGTLMTAEAWHAIRTERKKLGLRLR